MYLQYAGESKVKKKRFFSFCDFFLMSKRWWKNIFSVRFIQGDSQCLSIDVQHCQFILVASFEIQNEIRSLLAYMNSTRSRTRMNAMNKIDYARVFDDKWFCESVQCVHLFFLWIQICIWFMEILWKSVKLLQIAYAGLQISS